MIINKHIKHTIIYALMCIYSFALLKPVMPVVNDVFAHTFYKMKHLATVHYENGKHHLHVELLSNVLQQQKEEPKRSVPSSIYETLSNHIANETLKYNPRMFSSLTIPKTKTQDLPDVFIKDPTPPPKV